MKVVAVNGSYAKESKTGALIDLVVQQISQIIPVETRCVSIGELGQELGIALDRESAAESLRNSLEAVEDADIVVVGSPVFRGSYSGLFKQFFDLVDVYSLASTPVFLTATGGSEKHALMIDTHLRPLFAFFQAHTAPVSVFASSGDFDRTTLLNPDVYGRIEMAVQDMAPLLKILAQKE